jgi:LacI family transcriptional regulator
MSSLTPNPADGAARPQRPASIEDVAAAAAVSTATVSRLLNNPEMVAAETAVRIQKAIRDLGYRPNRFAQGLMTKKSRVLGILLPDLHGEFYSALLRGANEQAHRRGYHLLVSSEAAGAEMPAPFGLIDGLAVMITEPNEQLWQEARQTGVPVVVLDTDPGEPKVDSVLIDNSAGAAEATEHLLESVPPGRCYFVGGPKDNFDTRQRARAFDDVLALRAHRARPDQAGFGEYSFDWGAQWARTAAPPGWPIGVLAGNDEIAYGVMHALAEQGRACPKDVKIVGFDDTRLASLLRPRLSTVRVPLAEVGAAAVDALIERLEKPDAKGKSVRLMTRLVVRESSVG